MEEKECPYCTSKLSFDTKKCNCGHWFSDDPENEVKFSEHKPDEETFFERNKVGLIVFAVILGVRFVWIMNDTNSFGAALIATLLDSIFIGLFAFLVQVIYERFIKK